MSRRGAVACRCKVLLYSSLETAETERAAPWPVVYAIGVGAAFALSGSAQSTRSGIDEEAHQLA